MVAAERSVSRYEPTVREGKLFHFLRHNIHLEKLGGPFALHGEEYLRSPLKRALDLAIGLPTLVLSSPAIVIGAFAVRAETPTQKAFRVHQRMGRGMKTFPMIKIRSQREHTEGQNRIVPTFVGKILRKTSIDELPQLVNVLKGEMSLVGPRPMFPRDYRTLKEFMLIHLPYYRSIERFGVSDEAWRAGNVSHEVREKVERHADEVRLVTRVRWDALQSTFEDPPGITGLTQVVARRSEDGHRARLDNFYHEHASLGFDLAILIATIPAVLSRRGAR